LEASLRIKQQEIEGMGKPSLQKMYGDLMKDVCAYVQICVLFMQKRDKQMVKHMIVSILTKTEGIMRYFSRIPIFAIWMETMIDAAFATDLSDIMTYAKKNSPTLQQYLLAREN
jgi:hypothetical protein